MGQSIAQRRATKFLAPLHDGAIAWSRNSDGHDFVCDFDSLAALVNTLLPTLPVTTQAANYTVTHTDVFSLIEFTGAGTQTLTLPTDAAEPLIGLQSIVNFQPIGAGAVIWPAGVVPGTPTVIGGVTYDVPAALTIQRFVVYAWRKRAANEWVLS